MDYSTAPTYGSDFDDLDFMAFNENLRNPLDGIAEECSRSAGFSSLQSVASDVLMSFNRAPLAEIHGSVGNYTMVYVA